MDRDKDHGISIDRRTLAGFIDHTLLRPDATGKDVLRVCDEAVSFGFAAVCINPVFVPLVADRLKETGVNTCTVVGFPLGANATETKVKEAVLAVTRGAREIDMVLQVGLLKEGKYEAVGRDIEEVVRNVREVNPGTVVKVIIETCLLTDEEKIRACKLAEAAGANYVKTSTGFSAGGATLPDVVLMRGAVGPKLGVKASGGIRSLRQTIDFIRAGAGRIGTSSGVSILGQLGELR